MDGQTSLGQISYDGNAWSEWKLAGGLSFNSPPLVTSALPGTFDIFVTDNTNTLFNRHFDGTSWTPADSWKPLMNDILGIGSASSQALRRVDVYSRQSDKSIVSVYSNDIRRWYKSLYRRYSESDPVVIVIENFMRHMLILGMDGRIWHSYAYFGTWVHDISTGTETFISPPTVVSNEERRLDAFAVATDKTVMHNVYLADNDAWSGWVKLGDHTFTSSISAVVVQGSNDIELYGVGTDNALWHRSGNGSSWPVAWDSHHGNFTSAPALVSSCPGMVDVFAIGADKDVLHARWNGNNKTWKPEYRSWESLGGALKAFP
ncbi:hypothetical protein MMC24_003453 [Lignoscripta atroalba]|nr:hypothetical protein [Lignoscripta atroalba]